jgi:hypothetical protein
MYYFQAIDMKDFTCLAFKQLLIALKKEGYQFFTFEEYLTQKPKEKTVILRHDVDALAKNSLQTAQIEKGLEIKGVYYFRIVKQSNQPEIIKAIAALGHEVGYHYEDLTTSWGNEEKAITRFKKNLEYFRQYYPVKTICMHGSPLSKWDNKDIWKKHNYKEYGIIGEPYYDIDFSQFCYLTDTGRSWNGGQFSVRDKVVSPHNFNYEKTTCIIANIDKLPNQIMITVHPQRWNDDTFLWTKELIFQNIKNVIKRVITSFSSKGIHTLLLYNFLVCEGSW